MVSILQECQAHSERVWHISFHPTSSNMFATCGSDKSLRIWSRLTSISLFRCTVSLDDFSNRTIRCCEWSPCGSFITACSFDGCVYVWRVLNISDAIPQLKFLTVLEGHENEVKAVAWSPSGSLLATCGRDKSVWIWECIDEGLDFECLALLQGHEQDVKHVTWHPRREICVSSSYDNTLKVWGPQGGSSGDDWICIQTLQGHSSTVWSSSFSLSGDFLFSVSDDRSLIVWKGRNPNVTSDVVDAIEFDKIGILECLHSRTIFSIDCLRQTEETGETDNKSMIVATCGADDDVQLTKVLFGDNNHCTFSKINTIQGAHAGDVNCVRFSRKTNDADNASSYAIATAGDDNLIKLWNII
jgi:cytosolic iron-sulfur protein assembly protein CIAO1